MAISNTSIVNMAFGKIGANRINNIDDDTDTSEEAQQAVLHFEQTRDALLRSFPFRFARARATLVAHADTPDFEWDYQYILPNDFLAMRSSYEGQYSPENIYNYDLEGKMLLSNETTMEIRYVKKVEDPTEFDPLFVEVLVLKLAIKFFSALARGVDKDEIKKELAELMPAVRALDGQETNTAGEEDLQTFNNARYNG